MLPPILQDIIVWCVTALLSAMVGALLAQLKHKSASQHAIEQSIGLLLRAKIMAMYEDVCIKNEPFTHTKHELLVDMFAQYKALGLNGAGEHLYNEIMKQPIVPE